MYFCLLNYHTKFELDWATIKKVIRKKQEICGRKSDRRTDRRTDGQSDYYRAPANPCGALIKNVICLQTDECQKKVIKIAHSSLQLR